VNNVAPILLKYFRSWETFSMSMVRELWTADAEYIIVGRRKLVGLTEIVAYWEENSREQQNVSWSVERQLVAGNSIVATWSADFDRRDRSQHYWLAGLLWIEMTSGERIVRFVESFTKRIE
jgi:hypothetical protein